MGLGTGLTKQEKVIWAQGSLTLCFLTVDVSDKLTLAPTAMSSQLSPRLPQYDERIPLNCKSALTLAPLTCFCQVVYDSNTANIMKTLAVPSPPTSTPSSFSPTTGSNFIQSNLKKKKKLFSRKKTWHRVVGAHTCREMNTGLQFLICVHRAENQHQ